MAAFGNDCYGGYIAVGRCTSGRAPGAQKDHARPGTPPGGDLRRLLASLSLLVGPMLPLAACVLDGETFCLARALWATFSTASTAWSLADVWLFRKTHSAM